MKFNGVYSDIYRLFLFFFLFKDKVFKWLEFFSKESLIIWEDVVNKFLVRFYFLKRINRLRAEVQIFRQ
ncbi:hypothetical protein DF186_14045 [Enterococcus hirae]|nr:hypothetical protein DF186_14045 [Enterococcus hirae]